MGLVNFFRRYIFKFSEIVSPLYDLLKKNRVFQWTEKEEKGFRKVIELLSKEPVVRPFNALRPTELHTDASSRGLAAMLFQKDENGQLHLIYAISRKTSDIEKNYHSSKLELLTVVWAISRLRQWLINVHFTVITDCNASIYLNSCKSKSPQLVRWANLLSEYSFDIVHRSGPKLAHVDALSRSPVEESESQDVIEKRLDIFNLVTREQEILVFQYADEKLKRKRDILNKSIKDRTKSELSEIKDYELLNSILYKIEGKKKIVCSTRLFA